MKKFDLMCYDVCNNNENELKSISSVYVVSLLLAGMNVNNNINKLEVIFMCNEDIRKYANERNVHLWQIASKLGINDGNFSRRLRSELPEEKKTEIKKIVDALAAE